VPEQQPAEPDFKWAESANTGWKPMLPVRRAVARSVQDIAFLRAER
jgi:hypothetical protein